MIPVEEYLSTVYEPDCDYVEGELVDRNAGEKSHSKAIANLLFDLHERQRELGIFVILTTRVRISERRYRVPDVLVFAGPEPDEQIFTQPPFLCVEVLSPEDCMGPMLAKISDYLSFGVRYVWMIDPQMQRAWIYTTGQIQEATDGLLRTESPEIVVLLDRIPR